MERSRLLTIRGFAIGILAVLLLASAGVAAAKQGRGHGPREVVSLVAEDPDSSDACVDESEPSDELPDLTSEEGDSEEGDSEEGDSEEGDSEEGAEECPPAEETEDEPEPASGSDEPAEDRQAECEEAAGLSDELPELTSEEGEDGSEEKVTGLDNAIQRVLANCIKNPQAPGLLNALRHLAENRERKMARDEAKAERKAAHAAGKGHGHGKGHGKGH
jgi:hypothetical protein